MQLITTIRGDNGASYSFEPEEISPGEAAHRFEPEVISLVASGKKISAIKLFRAYSDAKLKAAKFAIDLVEKMQRQLDLDQQALDRAHDELSRTTDELHSERSLRTARESEASVLREELDKAHGPNFTRCESPSCLFQGHWFGIDWYVRKGANVVLAKYSDDPDSILSYSFEALAADVSVDARTAAARAIYLDYITQRAAGAS